MASCQAEDDVDVSTHAMCCYRFHSKPESEGKSARGDQADGARLCQGQLVYTNAPNFAFLPAMLKSAFRDGTATGAFMCTNCPMAARLGCYVLYIGVAWQSSPAMED